MNSVKLYDVKDKEEIKRLLESILYHFPGRTFEDLKINNLSEEINGYFSMFKNTNHYHLSRYKDSKPFTITKVIKEKHNLPRNIKNKKGNKICIDLKIIEGQSNGGKIDQTEAKQEEDIDKIEGITLKNQGEKKKMYSNKTEDHLIID